MKNKILQQEKVPSANKLFFALKILVAVFLLTTIFYLINPQKIFEVISKKNGFYFNIALLLLIPNIFFQVLKWKLLLETSQQISFFNATKSLLFGKTLASLTPGGFGELGRGFFLDGFPKTELVKLAFFDKLQNTSLILVFGFYAYFVIVLSFAVNFLLFFLCLLLSFACIFIFLKASVLSKKFKNVFDFGIKFQLETFALSLLFYLTYILQFAFLVRSFSQKQEISELSFASSLAVLGKILLPVSFGDIGIREITAIFSFTKIGVSPEEATCGGLVLFFLNILLPALFGFLLTVPHFLKSKNLKG
ncbi:flippase-like domain-containing protein [bacterium]|nr:flippase-like domain-containing protein [bacterium]